MDLMTPIVTGALLALFTALQTWINKGRFDRLQSDVDRIESDITALRSDLLQVALEATRRREPS